MAAFSIFKKSVLKLQKIINVIPLLSIIENNSIKKRKYEEPRPIFIVGIPRSGSTVLFQTLLSSYRFAYLTNIASLFYKSPILISQFGKKIFKKYDSSFESTFGYEGGFFSPSEAKQIMLQWFGDSPEKVNIPTKEIVISKKKISRLEELLEGPLLIKNLRISLKMKDISEKFPGALFVHIKRKPIYVAQSILLSKRKLYKNDKRWFGYPIPEEKLIKKIKDPFEQIVRQISVIDSYIKKGISSLDRKRIIQVNYEDFCNETDSTLKFIEKNIRKNEIDIKEVNHSSLRIRNSNQKKISDCEWDKFKNLINNQREDEDINKKDITDKIR